MSFLSSFTLFSQYARISEQKSENSTYKGSSHSCTRPRPKDHGLWPTSGHRSMAIVADPRQTQGHRSPDLCRMASPRLSESSFAYK